MRAGTGGVAWEQTQDQSIRWREGWGGEIVQVLIAIDNMAAKHGAKLRHRNTQFLGRLRFRVLTFTGFSANLHAHNRIVEGVVVLPN